MTAPFYRDEQVTLHLGDCRDVLATLPDASVDAIVTDPPYGLEFMGKDWDAPWRRGDDINDDAGFGEFALADGAKRLPRPTFTGSTNPKCMTCGGTQRGRRDGTAARQVCLCGEPRFPNVRAAEMAAFQAWCTEWATECLRVLKPGGHMLAFGGTRTWHRLAVAVEDAGFEIRDSIAWLYGSGFPKSLDVSKAIDKAAGAEREVVGYRKPEGSAIAGNATADATGSHIWTGALTSPVGITDAARQWQGWGTALKPAFEPVVVARKPLAGTVAANVQAYGTGALNIDACRIATGDKLGGGQTSGSVKFTHEGWNRPWMDDPEVVARVAADTQAAVEKAEALGRWPANVVLDESYEPVLCLKDTLPVDVERTIRESFGASTDHLPPVRYVDDSPAKPSRTPAVLQPGVLRGVDGSEHDRRESDPLRDGAQRRDSAEDIGLAAGEGPDRHEVSSVEGWQVQEPRLRLRETERPPPNRAGAVLLDGDEERTQLHPRASASRGAQSGAPPVVDGDSASPQWGEGRQPSGESGTARVERCSQDEARRDRRGDVPAAAGERRTAGRPLEVLSRECPPAWWQYFDVIGHRREGQAAALDQQSGNRMAGSSVAGTEPSRTGESGIYHEYERVAFNGYGDSGGASRFFPTFRYEAKAPAHERPVDDDGSGHPTVKPLDLIRWLARLITPPGGVVLDPFLGSGTTAEACIVEGFRCIGIEQDEASCRRAVKRLSKPIEVTMFGD